MGKMAFEVDDSVAKAWKGASAEKRKDITNKIITRIAREFFDDDKEAVMLYFEQLRTNMAARGIRQELLDDILK